MDRGVHRKQHHWRLDGSTMAQIFQGDSPFNDGLFCQTTDTPPNGAPMPDAPERPEEFSPGLPPELKQMAEQMAALAS